VWCSDADPLARSLTALYCDYPLDQIRLLEEKMKADLGILEDMQEFARARAKLEAEHALSLQRLAQQFHSKRKWPPLTYSKGHENM
jgi:hypothetical protein